MIRLLIIEKHLAVRLALQVRLQSSPTIEVVASVETTSDAEILLESAQPNVAIIGLAGERIRDLEPTTQAITNLIAKKVHVIVLTSFADDMERELLLAAGASRYLLKQIDSKYLITEIENLVKVTSF